MDDMDMDDMDELQVRILNDLIKPGASVSLYNVS